MATRYVNASRSVNGTNLALPETMDARTVTAAAEALRLDRVTDEPFNAETPASELVTPITSNESFYVRSHFGVPHVDTRKHRLEIGGAVARPFRLDMTALACLPTERLLVTLECAGNNRQGLSPLPPGEPWGRGAVSTARFEGVPLRLLLEHAGLHRDVVEVLFAGADIGRADGGPRLPYQRSLPLERALHPHTLVALWMNDEPLPSLHGGPVRLVVPGWYGMASVKWLCAIDALTEPFEGHFQTVRYVYRTTDDRAAPPVTRMHVKSMIVSPSAGDVVRRGRVPVRGWAWSGAGVVDGVEVCVGGGDEWHPALLEPVLSPYAWRGFHYTWNARRTGRHVLRVRATDAAGRVQPDVAPRNHFGYGNNAVQSIVVDVR